MKGYISHIKNTFVGLGVFVFYTMITISIFFHRFVAILSGYGLSDVDTDGALWYYWAFNIVQRTHESFGGTISLIGYPFGYDVGYIPFASLSYTVITTILSLIGGSLENIVLLSNSMSLFSYPLMGVCMYYLIHYLTRNHITSIVSSMIASFSYYFILMGRGALSNNHIYWIPIVLLLFYKSIDTRKYSWILASAISIGLIWSVNPYWAFFSFLFLAILFIWEIVSTRTIYTYFQQIVFTLKYAVTSGIAFVMINYQFFINYFSTADKFSTDRPISGNELLTLDWYFTPPQHSLLYGAGEGDVFVGITATLCAIGSLFILRNTPHYSRFLSIFLCFLIAIMISSNVPGFNIVNTLYFEYFGIFRSVSRMNILVSVFLAIIVGYGLSHGVDFLLKGRQQHTLSIPKAIIYGGVSVIGIVCILESINTDSSWQKISYIEPIQKTYAELAQDTTITAIAPYPMALSNGSSGFPYNFQLIGQIVHQKPIVSGLDPFNEEAKLFYESISNIENPETIDILKRHGVNTIIIHRNLFVNAQEIIDSLNADSRVMYKGEYIGYSTSGESPSLQELSLDIIVFHIL